MRRGFVRLYRKVRDSGIIQDGPLAQVFLKALLDAAHEPCARRAGRQMVNLQPGEFIFGRNQWAQEIGLSPKLVRARIEKLEKRASILATHRANEYTVYKWVNWETYAGEQEQEGQPQGQPQGQPRANHGPHKKHLSIKALKTEEQDSLPLTSFLGSGDAPPDTAPEEGEREISNPPSEPGKTAPGPGPQRQPLYDIEFLQWWEAYPRKEAQDAAWSAWIETAPRRPRLNLLLDALLAQEKSEQWRRDSGRWIPAPARYLRDGRWKDQPRPAGADPYAFLDVPAAGATP